MTDKLGVLVVDDSADLRELIAMVIDVRAPGWTVVGQAAEGQAAIEVAARTHPDLVLLDVAMPVMDGIQALPRIRAAVPEAVVVMLSAYSIEIAGRRAMAAGAHGYLEKDDLMGTLVPRLEEILADVRPAS